jgi:hypothetical protein
MGLPKPGRAVAQLVVKTPREPLNFLPGNLRFTQGDVTLDFGSLIRRLVSPHLHTDQALA